MMNFNWQKPKTDWHGSFDENGDYHGDYFNLEDYNRLNENLHVLRNLSLLLYNDFTINQEEKRTYSDYIYAEDINNIENNLNKINSCTFKLDLGNSKTYVDNGNFIDFNELNRLEKAMLKIYELLTNQLDGIRQFTFSFEDGEGVNL